jgi:crotonobetainyl-CoA:carnitine CoA-transferase CaiB-like acyl-CoA transferase
MESLTGMAAATGWPDGSPVLVGGAGDPIAGLHATFAALVALCTRAASGHGYLVEATMVEAALNAAALSTISYQLTGEVTARLGNRSAEGSVPRGVYPCAAPDTWVAIEVENDDQWAGLCAVIGQAADRADQDTLDRWLATATQGWDAATLVERLLEAGVPAAVVMAPRELADNPQLVHRGLFEREHHPVTGVHRMPGLPFSLTGVDLWVRAPSPTLGQHNDEVLGELGLDATARDILRRLGIIGEELIGA